MRYADNLKRFFLAWTLVALSAALCLWQGHVHLNSAHPSTMLNMLRHKYGILVLICVAWLWFEAVLMVLSPAGFRHTVRWPKGRWERRRWVQES